MERITIMNSFTPNYNLDLYDLDDKPNLNDQYNDAMNKIDNQLKNQANDLVTAETAVNNLAQKVDTFDDRITENTTNITTNTNNITTNTNNIADNELKIEQLQTDVQTAQNTAENAISQAQEANQLAVQANSAAQTAQTTANTALSKANRLGGNALFIGNSFLQGQNPSNYGIKDYIKQYNFFENAYFYWKPSSSFDNWTLGGISITNENNFNSMVNTASNDSKFKNEDINYVIFISAMGDTRALCAHYQENGTKEFNNLEPTIANARKNFPNAKIYIYFAEQIRVRNSQASYSKYFPFLQYTTHKQFSKSTAIYLGWGGWKQNLQPGSHPYYSSDNYHPSQAGSIYLGKNLINSLFSGKMDIIKWSEFVGTDIGLSKGNSGVYYQSDSPENIEFSLPPIPNDNFPTKTNTGITTVITDLVLGDSSSSVSLPILNIAPQWGTLNYSSSSGPKTAQIFLIQVFDVNNARIQVGYQVTSDISDMEPGKSAIITLSNNKNNLRQLLG